MQLRVKTKISFIIIITLGLTISSFAIFRVKNIIEHQFKNKYTLSQSIYELDSLNGLAVTKFECPLKSIDTIKLKNLFEQELSKKLNRRINKYKNIVFSLGSIETKDGLYNTAVEIYFSNNSIAWDSFPQKMNLDKIVLSPLVELEKNTDIIYLGKGNGKILIFNCVINALLNNSDYIKRKLQTHPDINIYKYEYYYDEYKIRTINKQP